MPPEAIPRILLFGGLNLIFVFRPIADFLEAGGAMVKRVPPHEGFVSWVFSEMPIRDGLQEGVLSVQEQFSPRRHLWTLVRTSLQPIVRPWTRLDRKERRARAAAMSWLALQSAERMESKMRSLLQPAGLLFDRQVPYRELLAAGSEVVSQNAFSETTSTVGRYLTAIRDRTFDALLSVGSFNCQPAQNSVAAIRAVASQQDTPWDALDCDGSELTANQIRTLENLLVQARRIRQGRCPARPAI